MASHLPIRVWAFGMPWIVILIAVGLAAVLISRRRTRRSVPTVLPVMQPTFQRPSGGGAMRRSIWVVVIVLIAMGALFQGVYVVRTDSSTAATVYDPRYAPAQEMAPTTVEVDMRPVAPAKVATPRKKPWYKDAPPTPVDPGPPWHATIEQSTFPSVRELNPRAELLRTIAERLERELHLHATPTRNFVANQQWVHVSQVETKTLEEKDPKYGEVLVITSDVELTPKGLEELGRLERAERGEIRMEMAARGLGIFTLLLGVIAAYIRLDEWTKGYYSVRLFLAALLLFSGLGSLIIMPAL